MSDGSEDNKETKKDEPQASGAKGVSRRNFLVGAATGAAALAATAGIGKVLPNVSAARIASASPQSLHTLGNATGCAIACSPHFMGYDC